MKKGMSILLILASIVLLAGCSGGKSAEVSISLKPGEYYGEQSVTLSSSVPDAKIKYTLDGKDPTKDGIDYDSASGLKLNYTSDLKASADGGTVAEAKYTITPYSETKDAAQQAFYANAQGSYATSVEETQMFILQNSTVTFENPDGTKLTSEYYLKDAKPTTATLIYTDAAGNNKSVNLTVDPNAGTMKVGDVAYTLTWLL